MLASMAKHAVLSSGTHLWKSLSCAKSELRLDLTLASGQSFRWRETADGHWTGVIGGRVWTLTQTDDSLWYHVYGEGECDARQRRTGDCVKEEEVGGEEEEQLLRDYFQLSVKLETLYAEWGAADPHFRKIANVFTGVRMLRQEPTECLFSFICTSNNHISRITGMVERLCQALGAPLYQLDQTTYHDFPSLTALADGSVETRLRDLGFGYRAQFLQQSAKKILDSYGTQWLEGLRNVPYQEARDALRTLPGVGTKVADCVCLMSLDKAEAVPIDTHVWQIAKRDYQFASNVKQKTITDKLHRDIGHFFRKLWGPYAGWTQSVLFCADLKKFQQLKETEQSLVKPKKEEENVKEVSDATGQPTVKTESKERLKKKKTNVCLEKTTKYIKKRKL